MKYLYPLLAFVLFMNIPSTYAQSFLEKVSVEELRENTNPIFPEADAVILNEQIDVAMDYIQDYGFRVTEKVSRKVKLYKDDARESLSFYVSYSPKGYLSEEVVLHQASLFSLQGVDVSKEKIEKEEVVKNDYGNWKEVGVLFKNAKKGDVVTYSYSRVTSFIDELPEWIIQGDLPKRISKYTVVLPEYFQYSIVQNGDVKLKETTTEKRVSMTGIISPGTRTNVNALEKTFEIVNVPAFVNESYVDNPINYIASLRFDLLEVQFPFSPVQKVLLNEKEFLTDLTNNRGFSRELKQDKYYKRDILLEDYQGLSTEEKIEKVLKFVQQKVKWDNAFGIFASNGTKTAYNKGVGNSADINLMLTSMLRYIGLQANPVLLSTRSNGVKTTWQRNYYNHVITAVEVGEAYYLLDATSPYSGINILPLEDLNGRGMLFKDNGSVVSIDLMPQFVSGITDRYQVELNIDGSMQGQLLKNYTNYDALAFRSGYNGSEWQLGKMYESQQFGVQISNVRVFNEKEDLSKDVRVNYSLYKRNAVSMFNDKLFVNPFQLYNFNASVFEAENRVLPIYFGYPTMENYMISIAIPQGYEVEKVPEDIVLKNQQIGIEMQVKFTVDTNKVEGTLLFLKNKGMIEVKDYQYIQDLYQKVGKALQQQVVFARKQ